MIFGFFWLRPVGERKAVSFIRECRRRAGVKLMRSSCLVVSLVSQEAAGKGVQ